MSITSSKRRGARTQALIAERWRQSGMFPNAVDTGAGRQGRDILNTPGLSVEVKAQREAMSLTAALRQAESNTEPWETAVVVWRHPGQGEASTDEWTVSMRLSEFEKLWRYPRG